MAFDFALVLVILTAVTGVVWGIDKLFFERARQAAALAAAPAAEAGSAVVIKDPVTVSAANCTRPISPDFGASRPRDPVGRDSSRPMLAMGAVNCAPTGSARQPDQPRIPATPCAPCACAHERSAGPTPPRA